MDLMEVAIPIPFIASFGYIPNLDNIVPKLKALDVNHILKDVGQLFARHTVWEKYALIVVHRQFNLQYKEILVEVAKKDGSGGAALPWRICGNIVNGPINPEHLQSYGLAPNNVRIQPQKWRFETYGELAPFEFHEEDLHQLENQPHEEFAEELFTTLKNLRVEEIFGIRLRPKKRTKIVEMADFDNRVKISLLKYMAEDIRDDAVPTGWGFDGQGTSVETGFCIPLN